MDQGTVCFRARGWASLFARSPLGDTAGQSARHASGAVAFRYLMRTGIAASRSESRASLRIGHQPHKKISSEPHVPPTPPILTLPPPISPLRLPFTNPPRTPPTPPPT